ARLPAGRAEGGAGQAAPPVGREPAGHHVYHVSHRLGAPWGVATIDLKTPERSHHKLFLSHYLQHEGGNSYDDRSGRISARPPMGHAGPRENTHDSSGSSGLSCAESLGCTTRHCGRSAPSLTSR